MAIELHGLWLNPGYEKEHRSPFIDQSCSLFPPKTTTKKIRAALGKESSHFTKFVNREFLLPQKKV
jgi:hypothetical protein